jgi:hypothetical protein
MNYENLFKRDSLYISPQLLALNQSEFLGFSGRKSSSATPPVKRNLNCYEVISPLNSANLVVSKNDNKSLSFSNNDLQIFA